MSESPTPTIWVDVEDLFQYASANPRPSGIQRLVFEILRVLPAQAASMDQKPRIVFARHDGGRDGGVLREVPFAAIARLFEGLTGSAETASAPASRTRRARRSLLTANRHGRASLGHLHHNTIRRLEAMPPEIGKPLLDAAVEQMRILRLLRSLWRKRRHPSPAQTASGPTAGASAAPATSPRHEPLSPEESCRVETHGPAASGLPRVPGRALPQPGDVFLVLGAAWVHPDFNLLLKALIGQGVKPVLLLYDLIPLRHPEWCAVQLVASFRQWVDSVLPHCASLMAISHATARDVEAYAREQGVMLPGPVRPIRLGTGFGITAQTALASAQTAQTTGAAAGAIALSVPGLPESETSMPEQPVQPVQPAPRQLEYGLVAQRASQSESQGGSLPDRGMREQTQQKPNRTNAAQPRARKASAEESGLPETGSYVLFVSTLEARKNHVLLFRVWRRLLNELPRDQVPVLVFAGRVGWLVQDLMQQLDNAEWLEGKIRLIRDPSDEALLALYRGCRFTLFPSFFEGWGLPVTESLALGRPCIASNRTSLPEAGGTLARYFDPDNVADATRVIRHAIENPDETLAWQRRVETEFRHVAWAETALAALATCMEA